MPLLPVVCVVNIGIKCAIFVHIFRKCLLKGMLYCRPRALVHPRLLPPSVGLMQTSAADGGGSLSSHVATKEPDRFGSGSECDWCSLPTIITHSLRSAQATSAKETYSVMRRYRPHLVMVTHHRFLRCWFCHSATMEETVNKGGRRGPYISFTVRPRRPVFAGCKRRSVKGGGKMYHWGCR